MYEVTVWRGQYSEASVLGRAELPSFRADVSAGDIADLREIFGDVIGRAIQAVLPRLYVGETASLGYGTYASFARDLGRPGVDLESSLNG